MAVASAKFEASQVLLPEQASWLPDLEAELFVFPGSRHDDQCDSISQALLDKNNSFMAWLSPEDWESSSLSGKFLGRPSEGMVGGLHSRSSSVGIVMRRPHVDSLPYGGSNPPAPAK